MDSMVELSPLGATAWSMLGMDGYSYTRECPKGAPRDTASAISGRKNKLDYPPSPQSSIAEAAPACQLSANQTEKVPTGPPRAAGSMFHKAGTTAG